MNSAGFDRERAGRGTARPRRRRRRKPPYLAIGLSALLLLLTVVFAWRAVSTRADSQGPSLTDEEQSVSESVDVTESSNADDALPAGGEPVLPPDENEPFYEAERPMLVNASNPIPEGYEPNIVQLGNGYSLESRAAEAWNELMKGAQRDGINLWVISAYRSHEKQVANFNSKLQEYKNMGCSDEEAYRRTAEYIAVPGTSEHSLGYAIDFCSLEESFEDTEAGRWLYENGAEYGFILRYPKNKEEITKIKYEPWHYRYVGSNHAREIMRQKICLEEYLGKA